MSRTQARLGRLVLLQQEEFIKPRTKINSGPSTHGFANLILPPRFPRRPSRCRLLRWRRRRLVLLDPPHQSAAVVGARGGGGGGLGLHRGHDLRRAELLLPEPLEVGRAVGSAATTDAAFKNAAMDRPSKNSRKRRMHPNSKGITSTHTASENGIQVTPKYALMWCLY